MIYFSNKDRAGNNFRPPLLLIKGPEVISGTILRFEAVSSFTISLDLELSES